MPYSPGIGSSTLATICPVFLSRACSSGLPFSFDFGFSAQILRGLHEQIAHHHLNRVDRFRRCSERSRLSAADDF